jgi:hypothetical protein
MMDDIYLRRLTLYDRPAIRVRPRAAGQPEPGSQGSQLHPPCPLASPAGALLRALPAVRGRGLHGRERGAVEQQQVGEPAAGRARRLAPAGAACAQHLATAPSAPRRPLPRPAATSAWAASRPPAWRALSSPAAARWPTTPAWTQPSRASSWRGEAAATAEGRQLRAACSSSSSSWATCACWAWRRSAAGWASAGPCLATRSSSRAHAGGWAQARCCCARIGRPASTRTRA